MRQDLITQVVPNADPEFIRIMGALPDPSADIHEQIVRLLPELYELFTAKRTAAAQNDREAFLKIVDREARLIERLG